MKKDGYITVVRRRETDKERKRAKGGKKFITYKKKERIFIVL